MLLTCRKFKECRKFTGSSPTALNGSLIENKKVTCINLTFMTIAKTKVSCIDK